MLTLRYNSVPQMVNRVELSLLTFSQSFTAHLTMVPLCVNFHKSGKMSSSGNLALK